MRFTCTAWLLTLAGLTGSALRPSPASAQLTWVIQTADPTLYSGWTTSLRLNSAGLPRVAEWVPGVGVRYASYDGSSWSVETVPPPAGPATIAAPARDSRDAPLAPAHVDLLITTATTLALDSSGDPWIASAVTDELSPNPSPIPLRVAHRTGGSWTTESIAPGLWRPSIELDASGRLHLCFDAGTPYSHGLEYGLRDANGWTYEAIDAHGSSGILELDGQGVPHVAYWDDARAVLVHAIRTGPGAWDTTTVPALAGVGAYALALGSDGRPQVAVMSGHGTPASALCYLARQPDGSWTTQVADGSPGDKGDLSLALDSDGDPVLAYHDRGVPGLKIAFRKGGVWVSQVVDAVGNTGYYTSVAVDGEARPVVSYQTDAGPTDMRVAFGSTTLGVAPGRTPAALRFVSVRPNPLRAGAPLSLTLALPADAQVRFEAFDASGRRVAAGAPRALRSGVATVTWDAPLRSPGLYFVRASTNGRQAVAKLVVTR